MKLISVTTYLFAFATSACAVDDVSSTDDNTIRSAVETDPTTDGLHRGIFDPRYPAFGKTYAEWSAVWWQWVWSMPATDHPLLDPTGDDCARNQSGNVVFVGGGFETGTIHRHCTIPHGKAIFFPIVNTWLGDPAGAPPEDDVLIAGVKEAIDSTTALTLEIDGHRLASGVSKFARFRAFTKFAFPVLDDPDNLIQFLFDVDLRGQMIDPAYSDGYYIMLEPLAPGCHTIRFTGALADGFALDVTYDVTVPRR